MEHDPAAPAAGRGAIGILEALVAGRHPACGALLPAGHVCLDPAVNAALWCALGALADVALRQERRARLPGTAGQPRLPAEDEELLRAYAAGEALTVIAARLSRTRAGVRTRLERHGQQPARGAL